MNIRKSVPGGGKSDRKTCDWLPHKHILMKGFVLEVED